MIEVGNIITTMYRDFNDELKLGIFLVLYKNDELKNNLLCCKITSKDHSLYDFGVDINKGTGNLDMDSTICVDKIYTIHCKNVKTVLGRLPNTDLYKVIKQFNKLQLHIGCELFKVIGGV